MCFWGLNRSYVGYRGFGMGSAGFTRLGRVLWWLWRVLGVIDGLVY